MARVIKINETGTNENCHSMKGLSGETSCWQMMPSTYRYYSIRVLGYVAEPTPINQEYVATMSIGRLAEQYPIDKVLLKWNAGENATKCSRGINSRKIAYNSCKYVQNGLQIYNRLK